MVDENMSSAARVHAIESGKDAGARVLIAFGGAAPLHAVRVAEKLGIDRILIPAGAGVGSAIGFLRAPISYEIVRSRVVRLSTFNAAEINRLFAEMRTQAEAIVRSGAPEAKLIEERHAFMRYRGQGHEVMVPLPERSYGDVDREAFASAFERVYRELYSRIIPGVDVEVVSWVVSVSAPVEAPAETAEDIRAHVPSPIGRRSLTDSTGETVAALLYRRRDLRPGAQIPGPAIITEDETSTVVSAAFEASVNGFGYIELHRRR
jgi:N-methylhydantoinase A